MSKLEKKDMPKTNQDLLSLEEREKEEFSKRVERLVKKEKQALVRRETGMSLLSPFTSILAVMVAKGPAWLGAFITARQASEFGHELKNLQEMADYRIIGSKLFLEFAREADASMPEVERDVKKADKLKSNIS